MGGGRPVRLLLRPLFLQPHGNRCVGEQRDGGEGAMMVGGPGVRLRMCLLTLMILDVTCWRDRKEVS